MMPVSCDEACVDVADQNKNKITYMPEGSGTERTEKGKKA